MSPYTLHTAVWVWAWVLVADRPEAVSGGFGADTNNGGAADDITDAVLQLEELPWEGGSIRDVRGCPWVVKFFHPECGGCRTLAGPYHRLALRARQERLPCLIASIDCRDHQEYCTSHGAVEFPLLKVWAADRSDSKLTLPDVDSGGEREEQILEEALWAELKRVCTVPGPRKAANRCSDLAALTTPAPRPDSAGSADADAAGHPSQRYSGDVVWVGDLRNALHFVLSSGRIAGEGAHYHDEGHDPEQGAANASDADDDTSGVVLDSLKKTLVRLASHVFPSKLVRERLSAVDTTADLHDMLSYLAPPPSERSGDMRWKGCAGSTPEYRGLPCGLWQLFHTILVGCVDARCQTDLGIDALGAIREWVVGYFNCGTCRRHFGEGSRGWVTGGMLEKQQVTVLWRFHNKVNARLSGDVSDDPHHPKQQFPPRRLCPHCYTIHAGESKQRLDDELTFSFLMDFYPRVGHDASRASNPLPRDGLDAFFAGIPYFAIFLALFIPCHFGLRRYRFLFIRHTKRHTPTNDPLNIV